MVFQEGGRSGPPAPSSPSGSAHVTYSLDSLVRSLTNSSLSTMLSSSLSQSITIFWKTTQHNTMIHTVFLDHRAFPSNFGKKDPGQNWEKMIDLTSKLGEINDIEHNKGSKIYLQNEVILDCIIPSIPLKKNVSVSFWYGSLVLISSSGL